MEALNWLREWSAHHTIMEALREDPIAEDTTRVGHRTWRNQVGIDQEEVPSLLAFLVPGSAVQAAGRQKSTSLMQF